MATDAIAVALDVGGKPGEIALAAAFLLLGDCLREVDAFKDAVNEYKNALSKAKDALSEVGSP